MIDIMVFAPHKRDQAANGEKEMNLMSFSNIGV